MDSITRRNLAIVAASAITVTSAVAAPADRWPMYQGDAGHTGYVPRTILPASARLLWTSQAQSVSPSGLAVSDGYVFTTPTTYFAQAAPLVAQSLADGRILWSLDFGPVYSVNQPAIDKGLIYVQTGAGTSGMPFLHCYQVDGTFRWRSTFDAQWERYLGPIVVDGNVYMNGGVLRRDLCVRRAERQPELVCGLAAVRCLESDLGTRKPACLYESTRCGLAGHRAD